MQKIREEFNKIRSLDKATESVWQQNDWQPKNDKMDKQLDGKGGFPEQQAPKIDFDKAGTGRRLKQQLVEGKVKEVLAFLIESSYQCEENDPHLLSSRWNTTQKNMEQGLITYENAIAEFNKITAAVLKMVDDMD